MIFHRAAVDLARAAQSDPDPAPAARVRRTTWTPERGYVEVEQFAGRAA
jgi:hypothetical protein